MSATTPVDTRPLVYVGFAADIVHHGHVNIIRVASSLGRVMVGLLTDDAILSYKRETIINWDNRRTVVAGLAGVDEVVPQTTHDYCDNLRTYKPKYVVHGTDWRDGVQAKVRQRVIDLIATWGGELVEPEYTPDISTTDIISKCHDYERKRRQGELPSAALDVSQSSIPPSLASLSLTSLIENELPRMRPIAYVGVSTDFLHHGHIHIINEAAKLGSVIVGILTDDAVSSYKGKSVVPYGHRVTIFQSLKGVARVVPQTSLNYTINLDLLKPEFVVHGDNWRNDVQRPVRDAVIAQLASWGGRLIEPAYTHGASGGSPPVSRVSSANNLNDLLAATTATTTTTSPRSSSSSSSSNNSAATSPATSPLLMPKSLSISDMIAARCFQRVEDKVAKAATLSAAATVTVAAAAAQVTITSPSAPLTPSLVDSVATSVVIEVAASPEVSVITTA